MGQIFNLSAGEVVQLPGGDPRTIKNTGSSTVYYDAQPNVGPGQNSGSIAPGATVTVSISPCWVANSVLLPGEIDHESDRTNVFTTPGTGTPVIPSSPPATGQGVAWDGTKWIPATQVIAPIGLTAQDILIGSSGSTIGRLPIGSTGKEIRVRNDGTLYYAPMHRAKLSAWQADATGVSDITTAMTSAIATLPASGGIVEYDTPGGTYLTNSSIPVGGGVWHVGNGLNQKVIAGPSLGSGNPVFDMTRPAGDLEDPSGTAIGRMIIGLTIDGSGKANGCIGVRAVKWTTSVHNTSRSVAAVEDCVIQNCGIGIWHVNDQGTKVSNTLIHTCATGAKMSDNSQLGHYERVDFRYCDVNGIALLMENSGAVIGGTPDVIYGWKFTRCHWEGNYGKAIVMDGAQSNTFDTCKWEQNGGDYITYQRVNGSQSNGQNVFINPIMNGCASTSQYYNGSTYPHYYTVVSGSTVQSRDVFIGGTFTADNANQGLDFTNSAGSNLAMGTNFNSQTPAAGPPAVTAMVTDPSAALSRFIDAATHVSTLTGTDSSGTVSAAPQFLLVAGTGAGSGNAYIGMQGRARFGFNGSRSFVQIDDQGTNKGLVVNLNSADRLKILVADGILRVMTVGAGLAVAEGSNAKQGVATLAAGTVTVANTSVTATSRIQLTAQTLGTVTTPSALTVSARTAGTSFTILASQATDTSVVAYEIFEPA